MIPIDHIILGDNQFFGVNHKSEEIGRKTEAKFKDINEIKKMMYVAKDHGIKGIFFSTHPAIYTITDMIRSDPVLKTHFSIYVNVPYIAKYARMISEMGVYKTVKTMLQGHNPIHKLCFFIKAAGNVITNNYLGIINRLIDVEVSPFRDLQIKAIFLHDALCDLLMAYDMDNVLRHFYDYIQTHYRVIPAFGTFNYPRMCQFLHRAGIKEALVMTAINQKGFFMNPNKTAVEQAIKNSPHTILAMSTLAAGSILPDEAYRYIGSLKRVKHVVVGLSSEVHTLSTLTAIRQHLSFD